MLDKSFALKAFEKSEKLTDVKAQISLFGDLRLSLSFQASVGDNFLEIDENTQAFAWGENLWQKTCFELFLAVPDRKEYWEWNFSWGGQVCVYTFSDYRVAQPLDPFIVQNRGGMFLEKHSAQSGIIKKEVTLNLGLFPFWTWALSYRTLPEFNLSCVTKAKDSSMGYWALRHSSEKANFHDRKLWARTES